MSRAPLEGVTNSPLTWPDHKPRTNPEDREWSPFRMRSAYKGTQDIFMELDRMGVAPENVIVSTDLQMRADGLPHGNQREPEDPGAAVWFLVGGEERVLSCDKWDKLWKNLRAITLHLNSIRGQSRWGVASYEEAFRGFTALPEQAGTGESCWTILGIPPGSDGKAVLAAFRVRCMTAHPDHGGTDEAFHELETARKEAMASLENDDGK